MNIIIPENYFYFFESVGERCVLPSKTVIFYESDDESSIDHALFTLSNGYVKELKDEVSLVYDGTELTPDTDYLGGIKERTYFW